MDFWNLFLAALMPVIKVLLITVVGTFLALDRFDILKENARKHLNTMVFFVFGPALVYSSMSKSLTLRSLVMLWFMPLNVFLTFIIGTALGWLLIKITKTPHNLHGLVLGCCAAGNLGNMPIIIVPVVCKESNGLFGAADVCYTNGMAYASLSMALGSIYLWTYVYNIVRMYSCKSSDVTNSENSNVNPMPAPERDPEDLSKCSTGPMVTAENNLQTDDHLHQLEIDHVLPDRNTKVTNKARIMRQLKTIDEKLNLKEVLLSPSTIGTIIGMTVGAAPPFRKALVGESAPLRVLQDSASMVGDACIPTVTLLVGANLLQGLKGKGMQLSQIIGIIVVKYIALPVLGVAIVKGAVRFSLIHHDPLYQFVLLLQFALPPAVSISTITQLFGAGEKECSVIMLATYACASVSLTLWSAFFMWLVE